MAKETAKDIQKRIDLLTEEASMLQSLYEADNRRTKSLKASQDIQKKIVTEEKKLVDFDGKRAKAGLSIEKTLAGAAKKQRQIKVTAKDSFGLSTKVNQAAQKQLELTKDNVLEGKINLNLASKLNDIGEDLISQNYDLEGIQASQRDLKQELADLGAEATEEEIEAIKGKQKVLGLESKRLKIEGLRNKVLQEADKVTGGMASKVTGMVGHVKKMGVGFAAAGLAAGLIGAGISFAVKAVRFVSGIIDELGANFGAVATRSAEFKNTMMDASVEVVSIGKGTKDVVEVTQELSQNFGLSFNEAAKMSDKILDSAVGMGLTNSEAAKLFGTLMVMGDLTAQQAERFAENTYQLAAQNGVAPVAVMKDIANSSEMIAEFGSHNLESLTSAAIQARKMGLNLNTVKKLSDSLLDFQSSIKNEMEASVMIGRRINLNSARKLMFEGKSSEALNEVIKQMGGIDKFEKLGIIQKRSVAKLVGMEVSEVTKLLKQQDQSIKKQKSFNDIMGEEGLSSLTSLINKVTELGKTFLLEFGGPLEEYLGDFEDKYFTEDGMATLKGRIQDFGSKIVEVGNSIRESFSFMAALAAAGAGMSAGAKVGGAIGSFFGPAGTAVGGLIGGLLGGLIGYAVAPDFGGGAVEPTSTAGNDGSHTIVTPGGIKIKTNPDDIVTGSTRVNDFISGPAGSMPIGGNSKEAVGLLNKIDEKMETLINETRRGPLVTARALIGDL